MSLVNSISENSSYTLILNSNDKISGTNNNGTYYVDWNAFLPTSYDKYKIICSLQTQGGSYSDGTNYFLNAVGVTTLAVAISAAATVVTVASTTGFNSTGYIYIDTEYIQYTGTSGTTFTGLTRGALGSTAAAHALNTPICGTSGTITTTSKCIFSTAKVTINLNTKKYNWDTSNKGPSNTIGFIQRDIQSTTTTSNTLSCFYLQNPPVTIQRPDNNIMTIAIYNSFFSNNSQLFTDGNLGVSGNTASLGLLANDMTSFTAILEFIPIQDSKNKTSYDV